MTANRWIILALVCVALLISAGIVYVSGLPIQPPVKTEAVVVGFVPVGTRNPGQIVLFETKDGYSGEGDAFADGVSCHRGQIVPVIRTGILLALAPGACSKRVTSGTDH